MLWKINSSILYDFITNRNVNSRKREKEGKSLRATHIFAHAFIYKKAHLKHMSFTNKP
jgi:hypothetical protein